VATDDEAPLSSLLAVLVGGQRSNVLSPGRLKGFARVGFRLLGLWMLLALHAG
jgi:hypothetical protein